jgi:hypothetical protein
VEVDTQDIQGRLPAALVAGLMDSNLGSAIIQTIWDHLTSSISATGSIGKLLVDRLPSNIQRNQPLPNYPFIMLNATTKQPMAGLTVTVVRSIDGAADAAGTLSAVTEHPAADGRYLVDFEAGDLDGKVIVLKATASGAVPTYERIITMP